MIYDIQPQIKSDPIQYLEFPSYVMIQGQLYEKAQMIPTNHILDTTINIPINYANIPYHLANTSLNVNRTGNYMENTCFYDTAIPHISYAIHPFGPNNEYAVLFKLDTTTDKFKLTSCSIHNTQYINNIKVLYQNEHIILFAFEVGTTTSLDPGVRLYIYNKKNNAFSLHSSITNGCSIIKLYEHDYFSHILCSYTTGKLALVELDTTVSEDNITVLETSSVTNKAKYIPNNIMHWKNKEYIDISINNTGVTFYKIVVTDDFKSFTNSIIECDLKLTSVNNGSHIINLTKHTINNKDYLVMSIFRRFHEANTNSVSEINSGLYLFKYDTKLTLLHHWSLADNMPRGILRIPENNIFYWFDNKNKFSILRINQTLLQFVEVYSSYEGEMFLLSSDTANTTYAQYTDYSVDLIPKRGKHKWVIDWDREQSIYVFEIDKNINMIANCYNNEGKRIKQNITLELYGNAVFKNTNTKTITIESSEQNDTIVPVYITGQGIIKFKKVV